MLVDVVMCAKEGSQLYCRHMNVYFWQETSNAFTLVLFIILGEGVLGVFQISYSGLGIFVTKLNLLIYC